MARQPWEAPEEGEATYKPVWLFVNESPDFVLGVEAGRIYDMMDEGVRVIRQTCHESNAVELLNLADSMSYEVETTPVDDTWTVFEFTRNS